MSFDAGILALPFYEPRHVERARQIESWCAEHTELWDDAADPDAAGLRILRALGEHGWLAALDPAAGEETLAGGDARSLCLLREALAYADDLADYAFSIQALAATPILRHGDEEQQRRYLAPMAKGTLCGAFAISEPAVGSDVAAIALRAERADDGYVLNGAKAWIANAGIADVFCVIARTGEGPGALGLTAFLVPADTPGLTVGQRVPLIAPRSFADLEFTDCRLPRDSVLGKPGGGFVIAMEVLERFRMTVGAAALGFARRATDAALAHAKDRSMYGARQFDLQMVKATFAEIEVELNAAALLVARAAWAADTGDPGAAKHSSIAKLYATERAQGIVDACVQVFGAAGLVADSVPERLYRQIRSLRIYEGTSEVQKLIIAGSLGGRRGRAR